MKRVSLLGTEIAYRESGAVAAKPVVFLHGNPTSSYLWRKVIPEVEGVARCLAPDLVGMGESGQAAGGEYTFAEHARHLDAWFDALHVSDVVLVGHDWGGALGFDWARRNPDRVRGLAYMETIVRPVTWDDWPDAARRIFQAMRSAAGEELVLEKNVFVERILPASILRTLEPEEMEAYRRPFVEPGEKRRPTLTWPRQIPIEGEPADVAERVAAYGRAHPERSRPGSLDPDRPPARLLPDLAQPARGHGPGQPLHPGGLAGGDRQSDRHLRFGAPLTHLPSREVAPERRGWALDRIPHPCPPRWGGGRILDSRPRNRWFSRACVEEKFELAP